MSPSKLKERIISEKIAWIIKMTAMLNELPLNDFNAFSSDKRNIASAESYLRRALEAMFDLGRHILAKGFGKSAAEYKEIAAMLYEHGILDEKSRSVLTMMAGYRNRMVHYYNEISDVELHDICRNKLSDIIYVMDSIRQWISNNKDKIDRSL